MMIIDRFEEDIAVIEKDDGFIEIKRFFLPKEAKEGDIIIKNDDAWIIDTEATKKRRADILNKIKKLGLE